MVLYIERARDGRGGEGGSQKALAPLPFPGPGLHPATHAAKQQAPNPNISWAWRHCQVDFPHYWLPPPSTTTESQNLCPKYSPGAPLPFPFLSSLPPSLPPFLFLSKPLLGSPDSAAHDEPYPQPTLIIISLSLPPPLSLYMYLIMPLPYYFMRFPSLSFSLHFFFLFFSFHLLPWKPNMGLGFGCIHTRGLGGKERVTLNCPVISMG